MNDAQLDDLKQFFVATVSQATANMATKQDLGGLERRIEKKLGKMIDDLDLKIDTISETLNEHLNDHETRITRLEQQTA